MSEKITPVTVSGSPLILQRGVLELAPDQAALRAHALRPVGKVGAGERGLFEIRAEVHFKAGEKLGWVGEIPKTLLGALQPVRRIKPTGPITAHANQAAPAAMTAAMSGAGSTAA